MKEQKVVDVRRMERNYRPNSVTGKIFGQKALVDDDGMKKVVLQSMEQPLTRIYYV